MNDQINKKKRNTQIFFLTFSAFATTLGLWAFLFNIDIISNAEGQVIPAGDVKTIQHLEGGIIDQILIEEGFGPLIDRLSIVIGILGRSTKISIKDIECNETYEQLIRWSFEEDLEQNDRLYNSTTLNQYLLKLNSRYCLQVLLNQFYFSTSFEVH